jgi:hypothetical protein
LLRLLPHEGNVGDPGSWEIYKEAEEQRAAPTDLKPIGEEADLDN